jgi:hypothetical protein
MFHLAHSGPGNTPGNTYQSQVGVSVCPCVYVCMYLCMCVCTCVCVYLEQLLHSGGQVILEGGVRRDHGRVPVAEDVGHELAVLLGVRVEALLLQFQVRDLK